MKLFPALYEQFLMNYIENVWFKIIHHGMGLNIVFYNHIVKSTRVHDTDIVLKSRGDNQCFWDMDDNLFYKLG